MSSNNSWLRVLAIVVLAALVLGAVAFVAYRIGFNQGATLTSERPMPPRSFGDQEEWFQPRMRFMDGRHMGGYGYHHMMRFGWHFFHPGFWLGLIGIGLLVFLLVKAFSNPATPAQSPRRRSPRKS